MSDKLTNEEQFNEYWNDAVGKSPYTHAKAIAKHAWDAGQARANAQGEAVAWRVKVGASDIWGYAEHEDMADLRGQQSGLKYVKQPLFAHPPMPDSLPDEPPANSAHDHGNCELCDAQEKYIDALRAHCLKVPK